MAPMAWSDIADKHNLSAEDRKSFFLSVNTLTCALSGNITLVMARGSNALFSIPVGQSQDGAKRVIVFREIYDSTNRYVRGALDEFIDEYKKWLKLK